MKPRLLDLFSGAGGAAKGYMNAGFYVVGVDIKPQPRYCGDEFHQADAMTFPLEGFDVIHASPPCQANSDLKSMWNARADHVDLIPEARSRLRASGLPFVIENVPGALMDAVKMCGTGFGLGVEVYDGWRDLQRHRYFESSVGLLVPYCQHGRNGTIGIYGDHARDRRRKPGVRERGIDFPDADKLLLAQRAMGIDWMKWAELSQAIPPAYTEWIGTQLLTALERAA